MQTLYKLGEGTTGLFAEYGELKYDAQVFEGEDVVDAIAAGWYETPWAAKLADEEAEAQAVEEATTTRKRRTKAEIEADKQAEEAAQQAEAQSEAVEDGANN
jgi:hypothetical protein